MEDVATCSAQFFQENILSPEKIEQAYPKDSTTMIAAAHELAATKAGQEYLLHINPTVLGTVNTDALKHMRNTDGLRDLIAHYTQLHNSANNITAGMRSAMQAALKDKGVPEAEKSKGVLRLLRKEMRYKMTSLCSLGVGVTCLAGASALSALGIDAPGLSLLSVMSGIVALVFSIGNWLKYHISKTTLTKGHFSIAVHRLLMQRLNLPSPPPNRSSAAHSYDAPFVAVGACGC